MERENLILAVLFVLVFILVFYGNIMLNGSERGKEIQANSEERSFDIFLDVNTNNNNSVFFEENSIVFYSKPNRNISRSILFENNEQIIKNVEVSVKGELPELNILSVEDSSFEVKIGEKKDIRFFLKVPKGIEENYTGKIRIDVY